MTESPQRGDPRLRSTPLRGWGQRIVHLLAVCAGWALFVWGWIDVLGQSWETEFLKWLLLGSVVILPAVTLAWIAHNVGIYRRKGPRTGVRPVDMSYTRDWSGREVAADFAALARAHVVVIDVHGDRKVYRAGHALPPVTRVGQAQRDASDDPSFESQDTEHSRAA